MMIDMLIKKVTWMQRKEGVSVKRSPIARLKIILFLLLGKEQYSALINKTRKFKNI